MVLEKRILQFSVTLACLVPVSAGLYGAFQGVSLLHGEGISLDSHFRYLSGLLLGIGLGFLSTVPHIEKHTARFRILTFIIITGGLCRLLGTVLAGMPDKSMIFALGMELVVTPLLCLWQGRVAKNVKDPI